MKRGAKAKVVAKAKAAKVVVRNSAVKQQAAMSTKKSLTVTLTIASGRQIPTPTLEV